MTEPAANNESPVPPANKVAPEKKDETNSSNPGEQPAAGQLSKEEQWALFEKELKESDWGHQPC
jgi:hypothetical protein